MRVPSVALSLSISLSVACGAAEEPSPQQPQAQMTPMSGERPKKMKNCPVTVEGARTQVERTPDGVSLTITADDPEARSEVMARTERSLAFGAHRVGERPHSGKGGGPETIGFCPVILAGNIVAYEHLADGVRIVMKPRDPREVGTLQSRVEARVHALRLEAPTT